MKRLLLGLIWFYQKAISPWFPARCLCFALRCGLSACRTLRIFAAAGQCADSKYRCHCQCQSSFSHFSSPSDFN